MGLRSILAGAAIILAATVGSAFAAEQFTTLEGVTAEAMTTQAMGGIKGQLILRIAVPHGADIPVGLPDQFDGDPGLVIENGQPAGGNADVVGLSPVIEIFVD